MLEEGAQRYWRRRVISALALFFTRRRANPGRNTMDPYRIYFLDGASRIQSAHWFEAADDETAMWIARRLSDACSDVCLGFDLWHMARRVGGSDTPVRETAEAVDERSQEMVAFLEETLRDSHIQIAASKRLLEKLAAGKTEPG